jgi:hypothetical protein
MPRQTKAQKRTVERVMHEFKAGELASSTGQKVKSRQQAIAIALSEAGASRRGGGAGGKAELYAEAKRRDIPGRSAMSKAELERALEA